jgi:hypothetical protein
MESLDSLRRHIDVLKRGVCLSDIGPEAADKLKSLFRLSDDALRSIISHQIWERLYFPEMKKRYGEVGDAYSETFEWIFEDDPKKHQKALEGKILYTKWLESRDGVFHITGKPGAGKSTLMRFVYKHERTKELLKSWAAGRKLVIAKFFFWRPGSDMQNSITALLQTLLYEVLGQCLDLVPAVFPKQWEQVEALPRPLQTTVGLHLDSDEISDAFDRLVENRNRLEKRCFFLFIDGLDEFS